VFWKFEIRAQMPLMFARADSARVLRQLLLFLGLNIARDQRCPPPANVGGAVRAADRLGRDRDACAWFAGAGSAVGPANAIRPSIAGDRDLEGVPVMVGAAAANVVVDDQPVMTVGDFFSSAGR
jgi:hypothetical protein